MKKYYQRDFTFYADIDNIIITVNASYAEPSIRKHKGHMSCFLGSEELMPTTEREFLRAYHTALQIIQSTVIADLIS